MNYKLMLLIGVLAVSNFSGLHASNLNEDILERARKLDIPIDPYTGKIRDQEEWLLNSGLKEGSNTEEIVCLAEKAKKYGINYFPKKTNKEYTGEKGNKYYREHFEFIQGSPSEESILNRVKAADKEEKDLAASSLSEDTLERAKNLGIPIDPHTRKIKNQEVLCFNLGLEKDSSFEKILDFVELAKGLGFDCYLSDEREGNDLRRRFSFERPTLEEIVENDLFREIILHSEPSEELSI